MTRIHIAYPWFEKYHFAHLRFALFVFHDPPLLKIGANMYFCSSFMSLSSKYIYIYILKKQENNIKNQQKTRTEDFKPRHIFQGLFKPKNSYIKDLLNCMKIFQIKIISNPEPNSNSTSFLKQYLRFQFYVPYQCNY